MSVAFASTAALLAEQAANVARAFDGARLACGAQPADTLPDYPRRVRVLAGAALFRAGLLTGKAAARECFVSDAPALSPSQWVKANVTEVQVAALVEYLAAGDRPGSPALATAPAAPPPKPRPEPVGRKPRAEPKTPALRRFASAEIDPGEAMDLRAGHPALRDGYSIFTGQVVGARESPRLLVSGHNNPKLGKEVQKGDRAGWPIFHLTLEERATCPRSCPVWAGCYGNAMPFARRHRADADLERLLRAEVAATAKQYPAGFLVRLHTLGDFYSVPYVLMWAELLATTPALHVFGYTARREDAEDPETRKIAQAIAILTRAMWSRFAIRTSHAEFGPQRSVVVQAEPEAPDVIVCPAQTKASECCSTCGLCWAEAARPKTIAFLKHGMKRGRRGRGAAPSTADSPVAVARTVRVPGLKEDQREYLARVPMRPSAYDRDVVVGGPDRRQRKPTVITDEGRFVRMKPINDRIVRWSRQYLARGVGIELLADCFDVDAEALGRATEAAA
jgi:hypothetical protein